MSTIDPAPPASVPRSVTDLRLGRPRHGRRTVRDARDRAAGRAGGRHAAQPGSAPAALVQPPRSPRPTRRPWPSGSSRPDARPEPVEGHAPGVRRPHRGRVAPPCSSAATPSERHDHDDRHRDRPARPGRARRPARPRARAAGPRARSGAGPRRGHGRVVRRAADAPRQVLRPAGVPVRPRVRPRRHGPGGRRRRGSGPGRRVASRPSSRPARWASHVLVDVERLVAVPDGVDPADAETVDRQRHHRLADAAHASRRSAAARRSWCSAPTAAWAPPWSSSPSTPASR